MNRQSIEIRGARQHNLKNLDLTIPRDKLVVITGLSGSGKSTLAFDTLYAEGQRRYLESLSSYARQFLGRMSKPDVDSIDGLSPAISITQRAGSANPRSTVGTVTEIYDYLRLLYARIGRPVCPNCDLPIAKSSSTAIADRIRAYPEGMKIRILAPLVRSKKGQFVDLLEKARLEGFLRFRVDGVDTESPLSIKLAKTKKHDIEVVVDRLSIKPGLGNRLVDSIETALRIGSGVVMIEPGGGAIEIFSETHACPKCDFSLPEVTPRLFSFNSPHGACQTCHGLGHRMEIDPARLIKDRSLSIADGALDAFKGQGAYFRQILGQVAKANGFSLDAPWEDLTPDQSDIILYGTHEEVAFSLNFANESVYNFKKPFEGIIPLLTRRLEQSQSETSRAEILSLMSMVPCPTCQGRRLRKEALAVRVGGETISAVTSQSVEEARKFFEALELSEREKTIAREILKEVLSRLEFLVSVGLDYLTLDRSASTLSGGEGQRINLACQIGAGLMGVLYILDEPSIGLHQKDNERLLSTLKRLRDLGNSLVVVEHDEQTIRDADYVIDMGPGAGVAGGNVVFAGTPKELVEKGDTLTAKYLAKTIEIEIPPARKSGKGQALTVVGATENNLKSIDVRFPLGTLTLVTGVSGSGKSTLINEVLYRRLMKHFYGVRGQVGACRTIEGFDFVDKVINIDQSPIGRTPRSNPATYTGLFNPIRELFALTPEARRRGYKPGRFSFNIKGGRCEMCEGEGILKIEMHFLPDVYVECEACRGKRYNRETLEIHYKGKTISEILNANVEEMLPFFESIPGIHRKLQALNDVGLGYIALGQSATTLSGGEAQRVKLAFELSRVATGRTLYLLDEPTTGLHFADIHKLVDVLGRLVEAGNTVIVIEHNLEVIKMADHIIDLGPEGGDRGGQVVVAGTPEEVAAHPLSHTGRFLAPYLELANRRGKPAISETRRPARAEAARG